MGNSSGRVGGASKQGAGVPARRHAKYRKVTRKSGVALRTPGHLGDHSGDFARLAMWCASSRVQAVVLVRDGKLAIASRGYHDLRARLRGPLLPADGHDPTPQSTRDAAVTPGRALSLDAIAVASTHELASVPRGHSVTRCYRDVQGDRDLTVRYERVLGAHDASIVVTFVEQPGSTAAAAFRDAAGDDVSVRGRIISGVVHDLNNQLSAARLRLEGLCRDPALPSDHVRNAGVLVRVLDDAIQLAELARTIATSQAAEPHERIELAQLVEAAVDVARSGLRQRSVVDGVDIRIDVAVPQGAWIVGPPVAIRSALVNLLVNARDAMPAGGRIRVAVERDDDGALVVMVQDQGVGLSPLVIDRLFQSGVTTKGGTQNGLGLWMVRQTMFACGGDVRACNRDEGGAEFRLRFPCA